MAVINTGLTTTALKGNFFSALKLSNPLYPQLTTSIKSTGPSESYRWLGTVPQMREWKNGRLAQGLRSESYSIDNKKYESTLEVDRDELADDQLGQIIVRIRELARRAATHPDKLLAYLLNYGDAAGSECYDAQTFFSTTHSSGKSGSQSNVITLEVTDSTSPTPSECKDVFAQMITALLTFKDDQGEIMNQDASGLTLLVHPSIHQVFATALNASMLNNTSNILTATASILPFGQIDNAKEFYLCKTNTEVRPFIFQDREALEFTSIASGSEEEFKREKYLYGCRARYAMAYGYWQYCVKGVFADAD